MGFVLLRASNVVTELHGDRAHEFVARLLRLKLEILKARESGEVQAIDDRSHNGVYVPTSSLRAKVLTSLELVLN